MYGSRAVAEKSPYKLGRHIRPFGRTRGTWSNPRRFRPHPPATGPSRLARPPGRRWAPWSGQVPPARQLAPRSPPRPPAPGVEPAPALGYAVPVPGAPWLRAPPRRSTDERPCGWSSSPPIPFRARLHAAQALLYRLTAGPGRGGIGLGGQPEGAQIYIFTHRPYTHHPAGHLPIFRLRMTVPAWHTAGNAGRPPGTPPPRGRTAPVTPGESGSPPPARRARVPGQRQRPQLSARAPGAQWLAPKNARRRPCQAGDQ